MTETDIWTIGRLLAWTTEYLGRHGSESPRLDAEVLLAHVRSCPRIALYTTFDEAPDESQRTLFRELVKRRSQGAPVAHLVGYKEFYSLRFRVTPDVLIPRPETETLVLTLLDAIASRPAPRVVDVGTGSGAIAVAVARQAPLAQVTAIDISPAALVVAAENAGAHGVEGRVTLVRSDLLAGLPAEAAFDVVASNPPYVTDAEMLTLPRDVRDFEPHLALRAGPRGVDVIERLIPQAAERLLPGGSLLIEISPMIRQDVAALLAGDERFAPPTFHKDPSGKIRVVHSRRTNAGAA